MQTYLNFSSPNNYFRKHGHPEYTLNIQSYYFWKMLASTRSGLLIRLTLTYKTVVLLHTLQNRAQI